MSALRPPYQAGRFYPENPAECRQMLESCFADARREPAVGAVAPHAGWVFSGPTAAKAVACLAEQNPETVVIFGAVHVPNANPASVYPSGTWETPLGSATVDEPFGWQLVRTRTIAADPDAHRQEHSIEVLVPLIQYALPEAMIVPIMVRPGSEAADIGRAVAQAAGVHDRRVAYLASSDLTHYGPMFGFEPAGRGAVGIRWAKEVNDRRMIDLIMQGAAEAVIPEASVHRNACGSGAIAALIAAIQANDRTLRYEELAHTTSAEVRPDPSSEPANSVGYHAGVFIAN